MKRNMGAGKKIITAVVISAAIFAGSFAALGAKKRVPSYLDRHYVAFTDAKHVD